MSKLHEIPWVIDEHTKVKHQLLGNYINLWMSILFFTQKKYGWKQQLLYFDGFAGPGIYWVNEDKKETTPGSPIIVANLANSFLERDPKRVIQIKCIDVKKECVEYLSDELSKVNKFKQDWIVEQESFNDAVNKLLDNHQQSNDPIPPSFYFIDPFGYTGFPIETLKRILAFERTELFINFMIYDINRFAEESHAREHMIELFGCDRFEELQTIQSPEERCKFLVSLYRNQLAAYAGAKYTLPFRINTPGMGSRPKYFLIHAFNHIKALRLMKDEMAKLSQQPYRFEAIGIDDHGQLNLFEPPEKVAIKNSIYDYFCGNNINDFIPYRDIEDWAYQFTAGISRDIKEAIMELEKEGKIQIQRAKGQKKTTVTEKAQIKFLNKKMMSAAK